MIKTIIKNDGSREPFQPHKINQWAEWASEELNGKVDWSYVVTHTASTLPEVVDSQYLQECLINTCLDEGSWSYQLMAGRLYAAVIFKKLYSFNIPTVKELHERLFDLGYMIKLQYTDEEYEQVENIIDHQRDFKTSHTELKQVFKKYSLQNRVKGIEYESQQFVYMRMAMALSETQPVERRMLFVEKFYKMFSVKFLNSPTPNFVNLGTPLHGYASCCLYTCLDRGKSLAVGDHIAYLMTLNSAGIGANINTRSIGDSVRGGLIEHQGKLPYYKALGAAVGANLQNGRGGAATVYFSAYDPEADTIVRLTNPMSTDKKKNRDIDFSLITNKFFAKKVANKEKMFTFTVKSAPDLYNALFDKDQTLFAKLYEEYENNSSFKKHYVDARDLLITAINESFETGRSYLMWADEANRHTPFLDPIVSSNLCAEIALPTKGYMNMEDLYSPDFVEDYSGEIALCSLAAINVTKIYEMAEIENRPVKELYDEAMYYALLMIDRTIHITDYPFPNLETTAKARLNAGVGSVGLAHLLARKNLKYSSEEGKRFIHELAEMHSYCAIEQSLKLGKELGNASWMHKTKWPEGWLPIDTYNTNVDDITDAKCKLDWEGLRKAIIDNGGIRNSSLVAYMPCESSSKASGETNGIYPVRSLTLKKTDRTVIVDWVAPENDTIGDQYETAYEIPTKSLIEVYSIFQKFTDQSGSFDLYRILLGDDKVGSREMIGNYLYMTKLGLKTRYYQNTKTSSGGYITENVQSTNCAGGSCKL